MDPFMPAPVKPSIALSVLDTIDVRVGTIRAIDDVAGSKKLVKLTVTLAITRVRFLRG